MRCPGAVVAFFLLAGSLSASETGWTRARSEHFDVYSQNGAASAQQLLTWFERLHSFFRQQTGLNVDGRLPVRVLVFRSPAEYAPFRLHPNSDAYYTATESRDYIVLSVAESALAAHEYWHFVENAGRLHLPLWLNEGLAEFFSTLRWDERGGRVGAEPSGHLRLLRSRPWIPLTTLLSLPADAPLLAERSSSEMFYAETWALAHMMMLAPGYAPRTGAVIERLASGIPAAQALESLYGKPLDAVARDLRGWVGQGRVAAVPPAVPAPAPAAVEVSDVSTVLVHSLVADILMSSGKFDQAKSLYTDLAREAPELPEVAAALAMLALRRRDLAEARLEWQQALDNRISDAQICYRFAKMAEDAGMPAAEVRPVLERAVALRPAFDDALFSLALAENTGGKPEAALGHLQAMRHIIPGRRFAYCTAMSDALNELGRRAEAKAAAETAKTWATTGEQRAYAERLAHMAETDLAVRFTRDAAGNVRLETARAPHDAPDWNPFIEPGDHVHRVEARLRAIECGAAATVFVLETPTAVLQLQLPDPTHVQMRNAPGEFTCGPQAATPVVAVYAETGPGAGLLRGMEFR
jgi:tetratricopeptide (TPR) repeat protein